MNQDYVTKENIARHFFDHMGDKFPSINMKGMKLNETVKLHNTVGQAIRNEYKLWMNNHPLTKSWFENKSYFSHPDQVSMDIINLVWRLANENWPFYLNDAGAKLKSDRIYAFADSGGFDGEFDGYATKEEAVKDLETNGLTRDEYSTEPNDLGMCTVILTGRQFIDQLYEITCGLGDLELYGSWTE